MPEADYSLSGLGYPHESGAHEKEMILRRPIASIDLIRTASTEQHKKTVRN